MMTVVGTVLGRGPKIPTLSFTQMVIQVLWREKDSDPLLV